jgi:hypothetical protein
MKIFRASLLLRCPYRKCEYNIAMPVIKAINTSKTKKTGSLKHIQMITIDIIKIDRFI